ncbi:uncharacterized protein LOC143296280 [Babylonia areolata]|uniref:uncharacterized protein LOC143296280 n=1 Tax=Babylonia areolata TaxID=304850 RepID=UPI003FD2F172
MTENFYYRFGLPVLIHVRLLPVLCFFSSFVVQAQDMGWVSGNKLAGRVSTLDAPGGRSGMGVWQDSNSIVWMFGGMGISSDPSPSGGPTLLNDVWRFTVTNLTWQQIHPGTVSNLTVATSRSPQIPRPRQLSSVCGTGHVMVLFGGLTDREEALGDLWVLDLGKRVWRMLVQSYLGGGSNQTLQGRERDVGPSPRGDSAHWCTRTHLYVFGGVNGSNHIFSDMWRLSLEDFTWEELNSSKEAPASLRDHKTADYPEGRNGAMTWTVSPDMETNASLFLFGGNVLSKYPRDRHIAVGYTSDMWQYSVGTDSWKFVTGNTQPGIPAQYGYKHESSPSNVPGCRRGGATWTDTNNILWLFGGEGADSEVPSSVRSAKLLSDLWRFLPNTGQWVWMKGCQKGDAPAVFKDIGRVAHKAVAGGRLDAASWRTPDSEWLFLFGGLGHDGNQRDGYLSDMWKINIGKTLHYGFYVAAVYGFAIIFAGIGLLLCLCVVALYARDRSKSPQWRRGGASTRYSQLHDSDT